MHHEKHVQSELEFPAAASFGKKNLDVKRLQEWLSLSGFGCVIDKDFGSATETCLRRFQARHGHEANGVLSEADWVLLSAPLQAAIAAPVQQDFLARLRALAQQHARLRGHEVGGENVGPWVRLYMRGKEGEGQLWCAGFVSFLLRQAALDCEDPIAQPFRDYHVISCDQMAADGKRLDRFLSHRSAVETLTQDPNGLPIAIFLRRKSARDWTHVGFALKTRVEHGKLLFDTVEGNSNQQASRNGGEVTSQTRAGADYDLIRLS